MASIDCWQLLGISPDVNAGEVRAAFAKRVRDVHPDSGGTGDSLTMRLLVDARDEALEQIELRGRTGHGFTSSAWQHQHTRRGDPYWDQQQKKDQQTRFRRHLCHVCQKMFLRDQLDYGRIFKGFQGRQNSGNFLMCQYCRHSIRKEYRKHVWQQTRWAVLTLIVFAICMFVF